MTNTLVNFRDIGGIANSYGKRVIKGRLFRSAELAGLEVEGVKQLQLNNIKLIVDLRTIQERKKQPEFIIEGINNFHIDILGDIISPTFQNFLENLTVDMADNYMKQVYTYFVTSLNAKKGYNYFLRLTSNSENAILFHCTAGKDRTGFASALLLKILGVSDQAIFEDYLKTIKSREEDNKKILYEYSKKGLNKKSLDALSVMYSVKKDYLQQSFNVIKKNYGDFDTFLLQGIGITNKTIEKIREAYLQD